VVHYDYDSSAASLSVAWWTHRWCLLFAFSLSRAPLLLQELRHGICSQIWLSIMRLLGATFFFAQALSWQHQQQISAKHFLGLSLTVMRGICMCCAVIFLFDGVGAREKSSRVTPVHFAIGRSSRQHHRTKKGSPHGAMRTPVVLKSKNANYRCN
jgi:hypothetical protein